jgi:fructosamine-3-kinase
MSSIRNELSRTGRGAGIASVTGISEGVVGDVWLVTYLDGSRIVAKTSLNVPEDFFKVEAEGLGALRTSGHIRTVKVLAVTEWMLVLEALEPRQDDRRSWESLARSLAALHRATVQDRFGWHRDGYLGWLSQHNTWTFDGHEFFAEHRLLRYLSEPLVEQTLEQSDRRAVERLCDRLPEVIPSMSPVLTHGDLWSGNVMSSPDLGFVLVDPAVSYTWAEVDLSMMWCETRPPVSERFFSVYQELNPSPPGWIERMQVLHLREDLSLIAHLGGRKGDWSKHLRATLGPFYKK